MGLTVNHILYVVYSKHTMGPPRVPEYITTSFDDGTELGSYKWLHVTDCQNSVNNEKEIVHAAHNTPSAFTML